MHTYLRIPAGLLIVSAVAFACNAGDAKTDKQPSVVKKTTSAAVKTEKKKQNKAETTKKTPKIANAIISVDSAHFDAGIFKQGKVKSVKHDFVVKNTGTDTLFIEKVKPG